MKEYMDDGLQFSVNRQFSETYLPLASADTEFKGKVARELAKGRGIKQAKPDRIYGLDLDQFCTQNLRQSLLLGECCSLSSTSLVKPFHIFRSTIHISRVHFTASGLQLPATLRPRFPRPILKKLIFPFFSQARSPSKFFTSSGVNHPSTCDTARSFWIPTSRTNTSALSTLHYTKSKPSLATHLHLHPSF